MAGSIFHVTKLTGLVMEATLVSPDGFCAWGERRGER